jgi:hypothetical protein
LHKQVFAKVNVKVDEGIKPVVEALNLFPMLETTESCQGCIDKKNPHQKTAGVHFFYGANNRAFRPVSEFVLGFFAPCLWDRVNDAAYVNVEYAYGRTIRVVLGMHPDSIPEVATAIRAIHDEWVRRGGA